MNISQLIPSESDTDSRHQRRLVRWLLLALVVFSVLGVASLATDIVSISSRKHSSGTITTRTRHTVASRIVLSAATLFHVALVVSIFLRSILAWSAAFALPALWALVVGTMNWRQLYATSPDWSAAFPIACLVGIAIWQTLAWRRQWTACKGYFQ